jgi:thiamine biosynthesis protein ThiS
MKLTVNGRPVELADGSTVAALLGQLGIDATRVAVERNQDVVTRKTWAETRLTEGDHVEIVTFVGGG